MRKVTKEIAPQWFEDWKNNFRTLEGREPHYEPDFSSDDHVGGQRRRKLRASLVKEQGAICCYCMGRITIDNSHIEHFWPKGRFSSLDLDYDNLFASCNGDYRNEDYCGHKKDDWWITGMIPPTDNEVEKVFVYSADGRIQVRKNHPQASVAQQMIDHMGLDSFHLERNRREAIEASEACDEAEYSDDDIRQFIDYYYHKQNGEYLPYNKAIIDCLQRLIS